MIMNRAMAGDFDGVGFALGTVTGARAFNVDPDGWLTGLFFPQRWTPGVNTAACRQHQQRASGFPMYGFPAPPEPVSAPDYNSDEPEITRDHIGVHKCGFYGFYEGSNDYNRVKTPYKGRVSGVISGFGLVRLGRRGFRCTQARLLAIQITPDAPRFDEVVHRYASIPMFSTFADMVTEFPVGDGGDVIEQLPGEGEQ